MTQEIDRLEIEHPVVLFDGICNLCNGAINFIIDHDSEAVFRFAPLQSDVGGRLARACGIDVEHLSTLVLYDQDGCHTRSAAALRIARRLDGLLPLLYGLIVVPPWIRDAVYDVIAANRYRWFGKRDQCRMPTPELRERFLQYSVPSGPATTTS